MLNRSFTYLLPVLDKKIRKDLIINTYLGYVNTKPDQKLYCLWKYFNNDYEEYLYSISENVIDYSKDTILTVHNYEDVDHYWKFINGQYSQFTEINKKKILKFHNLNVSSDVWKIMYKYEGYYQLKEKQLNVTIPRTQEIGEIVKFENECLST